MYTGMINKSKTILFWIIKDSDENKRMAVTITGGLALGKTTSSILTLTH